MPVFISFWSQVRPTEQEVTQESQSRELSPTSDVVVSPAEITFDLELGAIVGIQQVSLVTSQQAELHPESADDGLLPADGAVIQPGEVVI